MKAVGHAVQEGQSMRWGGLTSHRRIRCIGIATWGYVERNELLINPLEGKVRHNKKDCTQELQITVGYPTMTDYNLRMSEEILLARSLEWTNHRPRLAFCS